MQKSLISAALLLVVTSTVGHAGSLRIVNKTRQPIAAVQVSHGRDWGPDHLEGRAIRFGEDRMLRWVSDGKHRLRLINSRQEECVLDGIDFDDGKVLTVTDRVLELCR
ncbi:hypothetical protein [Alsobacter metallidurans]|uniref:hypothetical protein n=1 Tax=Alsobacter metallidurans TaxID=340221 RepID=UPI0016676220|nr:hypothetical protein [Alsobacter metallidurans]